ncbi:hypothetical protein Tco_0920709, partial [Tanacetum coccineum]
LGNVVLCEFIALEGGMRPSTDVLSSCRCEDVSLNGNYGLVIVRVDVNMANEAVLRACSEAPPSKISETNANGAAMKEGTTSQE